jgi:putative ABC transport system permease protein
MKMELLQHSIIEAVSQGYAPGDEDYGAPFRADDNTAIKEGALVQMSDYDYLQVLGVRPLKGAILQNDINSLPRRSCFINETMAKQLGYDDPVGRKITLEPGMKHEKTHTIDGVISDYHFSSLHHSIAPQILFLKKVSNYVAENILVRVNPANIVEAVDLVQKKIDTHFPGIPVEISFLDTDLEKLYKQETRLSKVVTILVTISLLLSVVGLVALCSYMIEFRQREIAIRKVLGAATVSIISLFTTVFVRTTILAFIVAAPVCYLAMEKWMEEFAYREKIQLSWFVYVLVGVLVITIGLAVSQIIRAANLNPTKVLKE